MTSNYFLNNLINFKHKRHFGKQQLAALFNFYPSYSIGSLVNLQCADLLYQHHINWIVAGLLAGFSGAICTFVAVTFFT